MKFMTMIFVIAASAFLLASCAEPRPAGIPAELRAIIEASRAIAMPPLHPDFEKIVAGFLTPNLNAETDVRVAESIRQHGRPDFAMIAEPCPVSGLERLVLDLNRGISQEDAAEEIRFLFDLLRYGYAGYQYFGGDDIFLPMRDSMLEQLALMGDPVPLYSYLNDLLAPALRGAIADNHFWIHNARIGAPLYAMHMSDEFVLRRSGSGFVAEIDGAAHRLVGMALRDGTPVDAVVPTLTREGEFAFAFGIFAREDDPDAREIIALLERAETGERHSRSVSLLPLANYSLSTRPTIETHEEGGIPVFVSRNFRGGTNWLQTRADFMQSGIAMRNKPLLIIDVRGNTGGIRELAGAWVNHYAREVPRRELTFVDHSLVSATIEAMRARRALLRPRWHNLGSLHGHGLGRGFIPNENVVIVLTDNAVVSAGEYFVGLLRQLENTLFVGTSTQGTLVSSRTTTIALPRSGLDITLGSSLNLRPDLSQFEGVGFLPDLWVPPGESLERVLAFIERYGLK